MSVILPPLEEVRDTCVYDMCKCIGGARKIHRGLRKTLEPPH